MEMMNFQDFFFKKWALYNFLNLKISQNRSYVDGAHPSSCSYKQLSFSVYVPYLQMQTIKALTGRDLMRFNELIELFEGG